MEHPLMKCGHAANGTTPDGKPACAICTCLEVEDSNIPDLTDREARCSYYGRTFKRNGRTITCKGKEPSSLKLAFFKHTPNKPYDEYYCGCLGWD